jgi:hypothetical protein
LLDQKVTKNQVSRKAFLPHLAFALQIRQNLGCKILPHFVRSLPPLQQILLCPCSRTWPTSFCLISPEAVLLKGRGILEASAHK